MTMLRKVIAAILALALLGAVPFAASAARDCFTAAQGVGAASCEMELSGVQCDLACPSGSCAVTSNNAHPPVLLPAARALTPASQIWNFRVPPPDTAPPRFASV